MDCAILNMREVLSGYMRKWYPGYAVVIHRPWELLKYYNPHMDTWESDSVRAIHASLMRMTDYEIQVDFIIIDFKEDGNGANNFCNSMPDSVPYTEVYSNGIFIHDNH